MVKVSSGVYRKSLRNLEYVGLRDVDLKHSGKERTEGFQNVVLEKTVENTLDCTTDKSESIIEFTDGMEAGRGCKEVKKTGFETVETAGLPTYGSRRRREIFI